MKTMLAIMIVGVLLSCSAPKDYQLGGRLLTKKKYDRELNKFNKNFVKNSNPIHLRSFFNPNIVLDTTTNY